MFMGFLTSIQNFFTARTVKSHDQLVAEKIADIIQEDLIVSFNDEILVYPYTNNPDDEGFSVDYITPEGMPGFDVFETALEAAERFMEVLDGENLLPPAEHEQVEEDEEPVEVFFEDEIQVLRQIFSRMKLANGRSVLGELGVIEQMPYVVNFKPKPGEVVLSKESWEELLGKIHLIARK
jgi:hypothetical protein